MSETGTAPSGDTFDTFATWITRASADGLTDRLWTVDIDQEACKISGAAPGSQHLDDDLLALPVGFAGHDC